ncbi:hypothetical protein [Crocosphaera watsonii]|uniref:Uncharacterized protein n=5 Tax=Crocosphaera watsonii TaxID=263511 RepID=T2JQK9_CROWT|nr:hypothetical protein CWATWH0003_4351 [Crocosphaera watsonii WH 0003]CCQ52617.1 hypothetical protein CWATWH8502_3060 [Crocosphaera watsonii WH 8502]CCQ55861.1 hypothetical protein CWATWH0005_4704 [Crocosphaera watsonii WH 0005]CCQ61879.1 hypothetical protein CWATWH0401_4338 [Crocosphaera watsonii WH 0401]CCQ67525.1 hypothetical protein CWATWH0402_743 [Crocosphaera watsonii WH 0402]
MKTRKYDQFLCLSVSLILIMDHDLETFLRTALGFKSLSVG